MPVTDTGSGARRPFCILALGLPLEVVIGTGLITEIFGFASGLHTYASKRLIDCRLGWVLLMVTSPAALLGTWLAGGIEPDILKVVLGVLFILVAVLTLSEVIL